MNKRNYNPLNEGYSGLVDKSEGYKGEATLLDGMTGSKGSAPTTLPDIQSAVVQPSQNNTADNKPSESKKQ